MCFTREHRFPHPEWELKGVCASFRSVAVWTGEQRSPQLVVLKALSKLGEIVKLDEDRWKHALEHPEMKNQINRLRETVVDPDEVRKSVYDAYIGLFYKFYAYTPATEKYILVIVKILGKEGLSLSLTGPSQVEIASMDNQRLLVRMVVSIEKLCGVEACFLKSCDQTLKESPLGWLLE
jgi:hypothetical protein